MSTCRLEATATPRAWTHRLVAIAAIFVVAVSVRFRPLPVHGTAGSLLIEPEQTGVFHPQTEPRWSVDTSGGGFVSIAGWALETPEYGHKVAGETAYPFEISSAGRYRVWVRSRWGGTCANSVTMLIRRRLDGVVDAPSSDAPRYLVGNDAQSQIWHWVPGPTIELDEGDHELLLGTRELGVEVDCILLTDNANLLPTGIPNSRVESATSPEFGHDSQSINIRDTFASVTDGSKLAVSGWRPDNSDWRGLRPPGLSAIGPCDAGLALAEALSPMFSNARIGCAFGITARCGAGIFFGRRSEEEYYVVRVAADTASKTYAGKVQVGRQIADRFEVLGEAPWIRARPEWERVDVWTVGRFCRVYLRGEPLLDVPLEQAPFGHAGLYVDGSDEMLEPDEIVRGLWPSPFQTIAFRDTPELRRTIRDGWPGLLLGYTKDECYAARWTNIAPDGKYAKRLELVRARSSGSSDLLSEGWGLFHIGDAGQLRLHWQEGVLTALSVEREICSAGNIKLASNLAGMLFCDQPRALFGEFIISGFSVTDGPTAEAAGVKHRTAGGAPDAISPPAAAAGDPARASSAVVLAESQLPSAVATVHLGADDLPSAVICQLGPDDTNHILWFTRNDSDSLMLTVQEGSSSSTAAVIAGRAFPVSDTFAVQLLFVSGALRVFVDGDCLFSMSRTVEPVGRISFWSNGGEPPQMQISELPFRRKWFALGHGWPEDQIAGRVMYGDSAISLHGSLKTDPDNWFLQLHGADRRGRSGYTVELADGDPPRWRVFRDDALIGSPIALDTADEWTELLLCQFGQVISLHQDRQSLFNWYDAEAYREGFVGAGQGDAGRVPCDLHAALYQSWDVQGVFHQEVFAASDFALWKTASGEWTLWEDDSRVNGYLIGQVGQLGTAQIIYQGRMDDTDLLVEVRLSSDFISGNERVSIILDGQEEARPSEVAEVAFLSPTKVSCRLQRQGHASEGGGSSDPTAGQLIITVLRTVERMVVALDHVPIAQSAARCEGAVRGVSLRVTGPTGARTAVRSICLDRDPLSPDRVPQELEDFLALLRDAQARTPGGNAE